MDGTWLTWPIEHWIVLAEVEAELGVVIRDSGGLLVLLHLMIEHVDVSQNQAILRCSVEVRVL